MASQEPTIRFRTLPNGRRVPIPVSGVEPETIMHVQVVRDGHFEVGSPDKPAATPERRGQGGGTGGTLGSFVLGEMFGAGKPGDVTTPAIGDVVFHGATSIRRTRFKKLIPAKSLVREQAQAGSSEDVSIPAVSIEEWLVCITPPGGKQKVMIVHGRLVDAGDVMVLQSTDPVGSYPDDSRVTAVPAAATDPESEVRSGLLVSCLQSKSGGSIVFRVEPDPEIEASGEA